MRTGLICAGCGHVYESTEQLTQRWPSAAPLLLEQLTPGQAVPEGFCNLCQRPVHRARPDSTTDIVVMLQGGLVANVYTKTSQTYRVFDCDVECVDDPTYVCEPDGDGYEVEGAIGIRQATVSDNGCLAEKLDEAYSNE